MKKSTESVRRVIVWTVRRSAVQIARAWFRRKVPQVWLGGRGAARQRHHILTLASGEKEANLCTLLAGLEAPRTVVCDRGSDEKETPCTTW
jgi:hypothetical protein